MLAIAPLVLALVNLAPVEIRWSAPEGCPAQGQLRSALEHQLRVPLDTPRPHRVSARGEITPWGEAGWRLEITTETPAGTRTRVMTGDSCEVLAKAAVLIIAAAVEDPLATGDPPATQPPPQRAEAGTLTVSAGPSSDASRRAKPRFGIAPGVGIAYAALPRAGPSVTLDGSVVWPRWRVALRGRHTFEQRTQDENAPVGARLRLTSGAVRGCWLAVQDPIELPLCVGAELGSLRGAGVGATPTRVDRVLWAAAVLGSGVAWSPLTWLALGIDAEAVVVLDRPAFDVRGFGRVWRGRRVGARAAIHVEVRFP